MARSDDMDMRLPLLNSDIAPAETSQQTQQTQRGGPRRSDLLRSSSAPRSGTNRTGGSTRIKSANVQVQRPVSQARQKDKFVPLPGGDKPTALTPIPSANDDQDDTVSTLEPTQPHINALAPPIFDDLRSEPDQFPKGRIVVRCVAEAFSRSILEKALRARYPKSAVHMYPEVIHAHLGMKEPSRSIDEFDHAGDIFMFDYGVAVLWGVDSETERAVLSYLAVACQEDPLPASERQEDEFHFRYSAVLPPHMQNDIITINQRFANDHQVKLAISHALAQSTKLRVYEQRVVELVAATRDLPEILAREGRVRLSRRRVAKLIGEVFLQRSAVYLLSSIMDTPDFFWSAPDHLQELYKRAGEYLELDTRTEVLGARLQVLQEMLDMLREHQNYLHMVRLEWIVIWLIVAEVFIGLLEILGLIGWVGRH